MDSSDECEISVMIKVMRPQAILVTDTVIEKWLPISQLIEFNPDNHCEGEECEITLPEWLAIEKGFA